jgi:DNA helicase HerA-like ATPase
MPNRNEAGTVGDAALRYFERIAKEGRKYGVGIVVISQRPSEVSRTVLSQCNNFVALRLTNAEDQGVVQRMLPDSLGGFTDLLPVLDTGEALVVGDASLLPSRIRITEPKSHPGSGTINFWDEWGRDEQRDAIVSALDAWRKQSQSGR